MRLEAKNVSIGYGGCAVFENISFTAQGGEVIGLIGINGIGKSTLLKTIAGLLLPVAGIIEINGQNLHRLTAASRAALISLVLTEKISIPHLRVREFVGLGRLPHTNYLHRLTDVDKKHIQEAMQQAGISHLAARELNHLSDGERQRVMLARALSQQTPLMLLDEPTAFLDFKNRNNLLNSLRQAALQNQKTVLLSTHDLEAALIYCQRLWIMTEDKKFHQLNDTPEKMKVDLYQLLKI